MLQLLRPVFPNLPCLFSIFHREYHTVLSRFCFYRHLNTYSLNYCCGRHDFRDWLSPASRTWLKYRCVCIPSRCRPNVILTFNDSQQMRQRWHTFPYMETTYSISEYSPYSNVRICHLFQTTCIYSCYTILN